MLWQVDEKPCKGLEKKRPSLMNKIVSMLTRKESMPMQSYRRIRKIKDSTSSCSCDDENESLLKIEDRATGNIYFAKRRIKRSITEDDCDENFSEIVPYGRFATKQLPK